MDIRADELLSQVDILLNDSGFLQAENLCTKILSNNALKPLHAEILYKKIYSYSQRGELSLASDELEEQLQSPTLLPSHRARFLALKAWIIYAKEKKLTDSTLILLYECQLLIRMRLIDHCPRSYFDIDDIFTSIFIEQGKEAVFDAIKKLPLELKKELLESCLNSSTIFGSQFFKQRGLNQCSLEKGVLHDIQLYLKEISARSLQSWKRRALIHVNYHNFPKAIEAYTEALSIATAEEDLLSIYLNRGNAFVHNNNFESALSDYHAALAIDADLKEALIDRANLLINSDSIENVMEGIKGFEKIHVRNDLVPDDFVMMTAAIRAAFEFHGKKVIFDAIKRLPPDECKSLLLRCLDKNHYLGQHFWVSRLGTACQLNKGTLREIQCYLDELEGVVVGKAPRSRLANLFSLFGDATLPKEQYIPMQEMRACVKLN